MPKIKKTKKAKKIVKKTEVKTGRKVNRLLGMKDILPEEHIFFSLVQNKAKELASLYSFSGVKTPIIENINLYKKSKRDDNDKSLYNIETEKGESAVLRPELTQGILRAYFANNLDETEKSAYLFSIGPVFRKDRLQSGHYRESTQFNLEIIGENKPMAEALLISVVNNLLKELQIKAQVQVNSLGGLDCMKEYGVKLLKFYKERGRRAKLCNNCKKNISKNILSLLDCLEKDCLEMASEAPQIADFLDEDSQKHFKKVLEYLDELNIDYNFNPLLVRGLNYYTETVFEFWPLNEEGEPQRKLALAGGGRFDNLTSALGGRNLPAVGVAVGLERVSARIKRDIDLYNDNLDLIFIAQLSESAKIKSIKLFEELRKEGYLVRQSFVSDSLKAQVEEANRLKATITLILGKKEVMDETIIMRDMESGVQEIIAYKKIKDRINKKINRKEGVFYG
jgi:histidyl-tRNA synthetase